MDTPHRYALGPMVLKATDNWPPQWGEWLDDKLHPASPDDPRPCFEIRNVAYTPGERERPTIDDLYVAPDAGNPNIWVVKATDVFTARCNVTDLTMDIDVYAHWEHTILTLVNALRGMVTAFLPARFDGLMFHASSAVMRPDTDAAQGVLFCGVSGQGKTTLSLGLTKAKYISDDISVVSNLSTDAPQVLASPFFGSAGKLGYNVHGPFAALALLEQSEDGKTHVSRLAPKAALREVMRHIVCFSADASLQQHLMDRAFDLVSHVPVIRLVRALETPADEVLDAVLFAARASGQ